MIKVLETTTKWSKPENGVNIILTHADMDGLVSAFQAKKLIEWVGENKNFTIPKDFIVLASMKAQPEETDKMLRTACKFMKISVSDLCNKDHVWILDRPSVTDEIVNELNKEVTYIVCDHHESSLARHEEVARKFENFDIHLEGDIDHCGATLTNDMIHLLINTIDNISNDIPNIGDIQDDIKALGYMAEVTNDWDTFRWKTLPEGHQRISNALAIQACDKVFGEVITWNGLEQSWVFGDSHSDKTWFWESFYDKYAKRADEIFTSRLNDQKVICKYTAQSSIRTCTLSGKAYRICFMYGMEEFQSMLSQYIFEEYEIVDAVIWMNYSGTISIRTSDNTDIKANDLAIAIGEANGFGGGGHPKAAGGRILDNDKLRNHLFHKVAKGLHQYGFEYVPELYLGDDGNEN